MVLELNDSAARLGRLTRRYERVKFGLLVLVLCVNLAIGGYLVGISRSNQESLTILRCAVAKNVRTKPDGKPRTPDESQTLFEACIKHGGPHGP